MPKTSFLNRISTFILSWEGVAFILMSYMLYTKIYGDGRYMPLTLMMCLCLTQVCKKKYWDKMARNILLFSVLFSIMMFFHSADTSRFFLAYFAISPVFFYLFGKIIVEKVRSDSDMVFLWLVISFLLGAAAIFGIGFSGQFVSVEDSSERNLNITSDDFVMSATAIGVFVSLGLTGLGSSLYVVKNIWGRVAWIMLFLASLGSVMYMINRTGIYVAGLVTLTMAFAKSGTHLRKIVPYILVLTIAIMLFMKSGVIDNSVFAMYESRRYQDTFGDRVERWSKGLVYLFQYPFGWAHIKEAFDGYMHNMWLDAGRRGGILCFVLLVSMTYSAFKQLIGLVKRKKTPFTILSAGLFMCFFASSFVEPMIDVLPQYLMLFMLLWGMIKQYNITHRDLI